MRKMGNFIKSNIIVFIGILIGAAISGGVVYAATVISSSNVSYSNSNLSANNVQKAIDEIYELASAGGGGIDLRSAGNFVAAYTYNASTCVTGNESTCVATKCYETKSADACPAGTIIRYKVKPGHVETFHVMYDDASTLTMQSQRNTVYNTKWISDNDYVSGSYARNDAGPLTVLPALESATAGWTNVNDQIYTIGTTTFKTNAYTGCSAYNSCSTNTYTLASRTAKARMITVQEAAFLGCRSSARTCPKWMYNYLDSSISYGGTANDKSHGSASDINFGYWTMGASTSSYNFVFRVPQTGRVDEDTCTSNNYGARAVVVVNKP